MIGVVVTIIFGVLALKYCCCYQKGSRIQRPLLFSKAPIVNIAILSKVVEVHYQAVQQQDAQQQNSFSHKFDHSITYE